MKKKILIVLAGCGGIVLGYWLLSPLWRTVEKHEALPSVGEEVAREERPGTAQQLADTETFILKQAPLVAHAHEVEGTALLVQTGEQHVLRFEKLKTIHGPDLRIYLATDLDATDIVDLGPIRATEGEVNYAIPPGTDLKKYTKALIWCRAFRVLFSAAEF
jgi:hypothetical protein